MLFSGSYLLGDVDFGDFFCLAQGGNSVMGIKHCWTVQYEQEYGTGEFHFPASQ